MTLSVAVLGAGYFARFHHDSWRRMADADLVAIADLDPEAAARQAADGTRSYGALDAMLRAESPDILDIAVPPTGHAEAIRAGLAQGVRAIICQKPFCTSLSEGEAVVAEAEAAGIPLIVHENFRFQPWYRVMRAAISEGRIGALHNLTFRIRTGDGQGADAYLDRQPYFQDMPRLLIHETAVHWIDTFRYLVAANPSHVYADVRRMNPVISGEDAGHLILDFPGNIRGLIDGNRLLDHAADNTRTTLGEALIEGAEGTLSLDGKGRVGLRAFGAVTPQVLLQQQDWPGFAGDCVHALQSHVVAALLTGTPLENTAADYLCVRRAEMAAYASAAEQRKIALT